MSTNWLKKWTPIAFLAAAPLAHAQSAGAMDSAKQASTDVTLTATPLRSPEELQIEALQKELGAIRSDLAAQRERDAQREQAIGDPDSHPLWP